MHSRPSPFPYLHKYSKIDAYSCSGYETETNLSVAQHPLLLLRLSVVRRSNKAKLLCARGRIKTPSLRGVVISMFRYVRVLQIHSADSVLGLGQLVTSPSSSSSYPFLVVDHQVTSGKLLEGKLCKYVNHTGSPSLGSGFCHATLKVVC